MLLKRFATREAERLSKATNAFEILQFPDKSKCGECGKETCLAFAGELNPGSGPAGVFTKIVLRHGFDAGI